jgi:hypothetical protein
MHADPDLQPLVAEPYKPVDEVRLERGGEHANHHPLAIPTTFLHGGISRNERVRTPGIIDLAVLHPVAEYDLGHCGTDVRDQVLGWHTPACGGDKHGADRALDYLRIRPSQDVAARLNRLRSLRYVADRHVGDLEDATLLLDSATVAEHAEGLLLEGDEVEQAQGRVKPNQGVGRCDSVRFDPRRRPRVEGTDDW